MTETVRTNRFYADRDNR